MTYKNLFQNLIANSPKIPNFEHSIKEKSKQTIEKYLSRDFQTDEASANMQVGNVYMLVKKPSVASLSLNRTSKVHLVIFLGYLRRMTTNGFQIVADVLSINSMSLEQTARLLDIIIGVDENHFKVNPTTTDIPSGVEKMFNDRKNLIRVMDNVFQKEDYKNHIIRIDITMLQSILNVTFNIWLELLIAPKMFNELKYY